MEIELEGEDGSTIKLKHDGSESVFGRCSGFNTKDRTVSRRHVLFQLNKIQGQTDPRVSFQVIGKNPLWLRRRDGDTEVRVFRKLEKGEIAAGDWFCVSTQSPVWFNLKKIEAVEEKDWENLDISLIDPVKEFGFLVIGHEFDSYPKQKIRNAKNWGWFLEETKQDDDSDDENKRKRRKRKRKGEGSGEDEEWSGESEEEIKSVAKAKRVDRPKYSTRSKDKTRPLKSTERRRKTADVEEEEEEEDEDDDTLGGFIVTDEEGDFDEEEEGESDEEEEFIDDEEEDLDD